MKIRISYPPVPTDKGTPLLAQNRQFQYFNTPTYIYPMVPASAATLLASRGYQVVWDDAIAEKKDYSSWLNEISKDPPDLIAMETKTPTIKWHWKLINEIKKINPSTKTVLMGDHPTAFPEESLMNSNVDYVVTGGDFDFTLLSLAQQLDNTGKMECGIWYRENGGYTSSGPFTQKHNHNELPFIDRDLTKWELYSVCNGNYRYIPGTYTMVGRDCWYRKGGGCAFCSWTIHYPSFTVRRPESLLDEIGILIDRYGIKEIFDDTGTFPIGNWLRRFCEGMIARGYNKEVKIGCNMRFGALTAEEYRLMKKAGFRFILYGLESANQQTLDLLNKGVSVDDQIKDCKASSDAGLDSHLTIMFGYPWETREMVVKTMEMAKTMIKKGYAKTWQVTIVIPYPGTPLFKMAKDNGWLKTEDWDRYDMREPVMKTPVPDEDIMKVVQELYKVAFDPEFIIRKVLAVRNFDDVKFLSRGAKSIFGHIKDFKPNQ